MKRANGTGTVVKLSGNRRRPYAVRVPGRDKRGRVIQQTISYHERAQEAQEALEEYNRLKAAGTAPAADKLSLTVADVFQGWSTREYRKLKPASIRSYNAAWNKRVSRFGSRKMREVTLDDWQTLLDEDEDVGLSQSSINNDAILIKALCSYAMERDIIGKDYSQYLDVPSVGAKHPRDAHSPRAIPGIFCSLAQQIGSPSATPHWCRHTFATRLHNAQADPITVKWLLGHSTKFDITAHYTHEMIGVLREAIGLLA